MKITTLAELRTLAGQRGWFYSLDWMGSQRPGPLLNVVVGVYGFGAMVTAGEGPDSVDYAIMNEPDGSGPTGIRGLRAWAFFTSEAAARFNHRAACFKWADDQRAHNAAWIRDICGIVRPDAC